jgi:hypothetical protein
VTVPIYLVTRRGKAKRVDRPGLPAATPEQDHDGIVSQDAVLRFIPLDIITAITESQ